MKTTLLISAIVAVLVIGATALLWILGIGNVDQLQESAFKGVGVVLVLAAVTVSVIAITKLGRHHDGGPSNPTQTQ